MLTPDELERYDRQIIIEGLGQEGQEKLKQARVVIAGSGGLGSPSSIYLGKFLANLLVISFLELFTLLIFFVFFPVDTPDLLTLLTIVAIGTIGIVALGNIISAISSNLAQSEVMLPVLLVPVLLFTIVMSSVSATSKVFVGAHFFDVIQEIKFILAFDVVFIAVGYLLIDYILED